MHVNILTNSEQALHCGGCHAEVGEEEHFSIVLGKLLNKTVHDISLNAASNDRIIRTTIEYFESGNTADVAVIILSPNNRFDYPIEYNSYQEVTEEGVNLHEWPKENYLDFQQYFSKIYNPFVGSDNFFKNQFLLETYFKMKNIPNLIMSYHGNYGIIPSPWKNWVSPLKSIKSILGKEGLDNENYHTHHPSDIGHRKIAEHISEHIREYL